MVTIREQPRFCMHIYRRTYMYRRNIVLLCAKGISWAFTTACTATGHIEECYDMHLAYRITPVLHATRMLLLSIIGKRALRMLGGRIPFRK